MFFILSIGEKTASYVSYNYTTYFINMNLQDTVYYKWSKGLSACRFSCDKNNVLVFNT